ncbi:NfeD family protein [Xylanibacter rodentium]|jgi:membrane protein implicated in regulation of membrane protease activity|uniref:NfeD family protein n=1 Tax=Xylanibacter rodentium TaxID=2736289 RepID=A0ABX2AUS6_9BACT|nr:NfeD family protein [Xylanibacter rodentium]NPE10655.1 NfeD family protein [Prevotella sp. PJ1A]NPE13896.1 NfeD family protein [Xylanibacter rodentium]NPE38118.1 NfeD family protein [Prevotella sp. PCJ2]
MEQSQVFWLIAIVSTGVFVVQFILSIFFGDIDVDIDGDATADTDVSSLVSFKGLVHFGIGFGWMMVLRGGEATLKNILVAVVTGLVFVFVLWRMYVLVLRLQKETQTEDPKALVGRYGTVYNNMGDGRYIIQITHNGAIRELDVVSESQYCGYKTGERITVVRHEDNKYYVK